MMVTDPQVRKNKNYNFLDISDNLEALFVLANPP